MCTFTDEHTVIVCDIAIDQVRERLQEVFGEVVQYTSVDRKSTRVQAPATIDASHFQATAREAIAAAQAPSA